MKKILILWIFETTNFVLLIPRWPVRETEALVMSCHCGMLYQVGYCELLPQNHWYRQLGTQFSWLKAAAGWPGLFCILVDGMGWLLWTIATLKHWNRFLGGGYVMSFWSGRLLWTCDNKTKILFVMIMRKLSQWLEIKT